MHRTDETDEMSGLKQTPSPSNHERTEVKIEVN